MLRSATGEQLCFALRERIDCISGEPPRISDGWKIDLG